MLRSSLRAAAPAVDNVALIFVKPHANTPAAVEFARAFLQERGLQIAREGSVVAKDIDEQCIIDAHYAAIARVGMARDINALGLDAGAAEKFEAGYGLSFADAMAAGSVHSAITGLEVMDVSPAELLSQCLAAGYVKLGPGLYCAKLAGKDGEPLYVLNGFYARMREKFVAPGVVVNWFVVRFDASTLPWKTFRSEVIGATNPVDSAAGSLRAAFRDRWQELGLQEETNYQDNAVHASAGPLEAVKERSVWLGEGAAADGAFGSALAAAAGGTACLEALLENPEVDFGTRGRGSAFDLLEDVDSAEALEIIAAGAGGRRLT